MIVLGANATQKIGLVRVHVGETRIWSILKRCVKRAESSSLCRTHGISVCRQTLMGNFACQDDEATIAGLSVSSNKRNDKYIRLQKTTTTKPHEQGVEIERADPTKERGAVRGYRGLQENSDAEREGYERKMREQERQTRYKRKYYNSSRCLGCAVGGTPSSCNAVSSSRT